jgi:hypothetical protein
MPNTTEPETSVIIHCGEECKRFNVPPLHLNPNLCVSAVIASIDHQIRYLDMLGGYSADLIRDADGKRDEIIGRIRILSILIDEFPEDRGIVAYLRKATFAAHKKAIAKIRSRR